MFGVYMLFIGFVVWEWVFSESDEQWADDFNMDYPDRGPW